MRACALERGHAGLAKAANSSCPNSHEQAAMSPEDMEVVVAKIISLLVLTLLSVLAGLMPLRLLLHLPQLFTRHRPTVDYFLCGLRCVSGGVFLATGFLHLLPDTRDKMAAVLLNQGSVTTYAVTELLIMAGFFLVVFVEQIIQCLYLKAEHSDQMRASSSTADIATGNRDVETGVVFNSNGGGAGASASASGGGGRYRFCPDRAVIPSTLEEMEEESPDSCGGDTRDYGGPGAAYDFGGGGGGGSENTAVVSTLHSGGGGNGGKDGGGCAMTYTGNGIGGGCSLAAQDMDSDSFGSDTLMKEEQHAFMDTRLDLDLGIHHDFDLDLEQVPVTLRCSRHSMTLRHSLPDLGVTRVVKQLSQGDLTRRAHFRSIIYIMALSLHGIFEGLALGLQSHESSVWSLCFALCLHRCVLAFQLGMDLCGARESQGTAFLCIGTFTLISALGIVAGILFSSGAMLYADVTVPEAILQSLSTGTILYIVFFDILFKDLKGKGDLKRISCCFVGFALMAIILAITRR